jgi:hypothetical protein
LFDVVHDQWSTSKSFRRYFHQQKILTSNIKSKERFQMLDDIYTYI